MMFKLNEKGLTLVEVIITTAILLVVLTGVYGILGGTLKLWKYGSERIDAQQNARIAMQMMERDIKNAKRYSDDTYIFIKGDGSEIRFKLDNENGIQDTIKYYKSGNLLLRKINNGGANQVAYNIKKLEFNFYTDPDTLETNRSIVTIYLEVEYDDSVYPLSSKVYVRAVNF